MTMFLRQSTASQEICLGCFVSSSDGDTAQTGLTINASDIKLFKEGATTFANKNSGGATEISGGYYYAVLDATDTNTVGNLEVHCKVSGSLAVKREYRVLEEAVYDAYFAASATNYVDGITAAGMARLFTVDTGTTSASAIEGSVAKEIFDVFDDNAVDLTIVDGAVKVDSFSTAGKAELQTEANDALVANNLDHWMAAAVTNSDVTNDSALAKLASKSVTAVWSGFDNTTDSLEANRDNIGTAGAGLSSAPGGSASPQLLQTTTIATLTSQTQFTLTDGSADNDAYNDCLAIFTDAVTSTQKGVAEIRDYVGSTKTVYLTEPTAFTIAATDAINVVAHRPPKPPISLVTVPGSRTLTVGTRRDDDEPVVSRAIRMQAGETLYWKVNFNRTQLSREDVLDSAITPAISGAQAANLTLSDWGISGVDGAGIVMLLAMGGGALTTDDITITLTVVPDAGETLIIPIDVTVID